MNKYRALIAFIIAQLLALPAYAILPQQGMWFIGSELNGKPGRGIQLDRQGGQYMIITYFGYRPDGSSMFLQASGKMEDGITFSGELTEFKNGRAMGGAARDGETAKVIGRVVIDFDNPTSGTITLPGEKPQPFTRFQYEDHLKRINNHFEYYTYDRFLRTGLNTVATIEAKNTDFKMSENFENGNSCQYSGKIQRTGESFSSYGNVNCTLNLPILGHNLDRYEIIDLKVDERAMLSGRIYYSSSKDTATIPYRIFRDIQGICAAPEDPANPGKKYRCSDLGVHGGHTFDFR